MVNESFQVPGGESMSQFGVEQTADTAGIKPHDAWPSAILEAWDGLIYVCGPDDRIHYMNRRFIARLGRDATGEFSEQTGIELELKGSNENTASSLTRNRMQFCPSTQEPVGFAR